MASSFSSHLLSITLPTAYLFCILIKTRIYFKVSYNVCTISAICQVVGSLWARVQSVCWLISTSKLIEHFRHTMPHNTEHNTPVHTQHTESVKQSLWFTFIWLIDMVLEVKGQASEVVKRPLILTLRRLFHSWLFLVLSKQFCM